MVPVPLSGVFAVVRLGTTYHDVPYCSARKRYVLVSPGGSGHSVIPLAPSLTALYLMRIPCQWIDVLSALALNRQDPRNTDVPLAGEIVSDGDLDPVPPI